MMVAVVVSVVVAAVQQLYYNVQYSFYSYTNTCITILTSTCFQRILGDVVNEDSGSCATIGTAFGVERSSLHSKASVPKCGQGVSSV